MENNSYTKKTIKNRLRAKYGEGKGLFGFGSRYTQSQIAGIMREMNTKNRNRSNMINNNLKDEYNLITDPNIKSEIDNILKKQDQNLIDNPKINSLRNNKKLAAQQRAFTPYTTAEIAEAMRKFKPIYNNRETRKKKDAAAKARREEEAAADKARREKKAKEYAADKARREEEAKEYEKILAAAQAADIELEKTLGPEEFDRITIENYNNEKANFDARQSGYYQGQQGVFPPIKARTPGQAKRFEEEKQKSAAKVDPSTSAYYQGYQGYMGGRYNRKKSSQKRRQSTKKIRS